MLRVVRCGTRHSSRVRARAPHVLCGGYKLALHVFQGGLSHHGRTGASDEENGGGGTGGAISGEPVIETSLCGILYADDAGVVSQSPE